MLVANAILVYSLHPKLHQTLINGGVHKRHLFMQCIAKADINPPSAIGITFARYSLGDDCGVIFQLYMFRTFCAVDICWIDTYAITKVAK